MRLNGLVADCTNEAIAAVLGVGGMEAAAVDEEK